MNAAHPPPTKSHLRGRPPLASMNAAHLDGGPWTMRLIGVMDSPFTREPLPGFLSAPLG